MKNDPHFKPWSAGSDTPHNREQALAVLAEWAKPGVMTFSSSRCARIHECLTTPTPRTLPPAVRMLAGLGWQWGDADGWHGKYDYPEDAFQAGYEAQLAHAQADVPKTYDCSVCKDNDAKCSKNYSGGWVGTKCPN